MDKIAKKANVQQKKALVQGLFLSKLCYCLPVWSDLNADTIRTLQVLQNDAVRFIYNKKRCDRLKPLYKSLNWLQFRGLSQYFDQLQLYTNRETRTPIDCKVGGTVRESLNTNS